MHCLPFPTTAGDKGTGVSVGLILRAEDSESRSHSQENDSLPLIGVPFSVPVNGTISTVHGT
jgi:hypothetical protein